VRILGNVLWFLIAGWELFLAYVIAGLIAFVLIITIPFGIASFRIAGYVVWPFGRTVVSKPTAGVGSAIGNVLWLVLFGWWLALAHIITGLLLMITIIGIPFGIANWKMVPLALLPLGREVVPIEVAEYRDSFGLPQPQPGQTA
jgi:uncharacterized membrane protein YccF (DUF307 family)